MNIDEMTPDELRRRLREALREIEHLKRALVEASSEQRLVADRFLRHRTGLDERPDL